MTVGTGTISLRRRTTGGDSPLYRWTIVIDDVECGKIGFRGVVSVEVEPGLHTVSVRAPLTQRSVPFTVTVAAGEHIHLVCSLPALAFRVKVEPAPDKPARRPSHSRTPTAPAAARSPSGETLTLRETHRTEEAIGDEARTIDNNSDGTVTRTVTVSKKWSKTYRVGSETTRSAEASLGADMLMLSVRARIEQALKTSYDLETTEENLIAETVTINVPAHTSTRLVLTWKRLWQHGVVRVTGADGPATELPFQVAVGLTFDQSQVDVGEH